jgi:hypothetical protein
MANWPLTDRELQVDPGERTPHRDPSPSRLTVQW